MLALEQLDRGIEHRALVLDTADCDPPIALRMKGEREHLDLPGQRCPSPDACLGRAGDQCHQRRTKLDRHRRAHSRCCPQSRKKLSLTCGQA
jgi:hypothetical protein